MATFSVKSGRSVEYPGNVYFTVRLSEPQTYDVTVDYATWSGTAIVGTDVSKTIRTLEFDAGEVEKTFYINGYNNSVAEPDESFILELFNPVGADFAGRTLTLRTAGWLLDDEPGSGARSLAVIAPVVSNPRPRPPSPSACPRRSAAQRPSTLPLSPGRPTPAPTSSAGPAP